MGKNKKNRKTRGKMFFYLILWMLAVLGLAYLFFEIFSA